MCLIVIYSQLEMLNASTFVLFSKVSSVRESFNNALWVAFRVVVVEGIALLIRGLPSNGEGSSVVGQVAEVLVAGGSVSIMLEFTLRLKLVS